MGTHKSPFQGNKFKTRTLIRLQPQNVNLQRTRYKIRSKRALTGGPWRGTRPSSSPPTLRTTRSTKATNTNQNTITAPAHSERETTENRAYREETLQERDLDGRRRPWRWMDGTVRRSPPVRRERGTARSSGFPSLSLRYPSPPTAKNTGNALPGMACGEGEPEERERRGKHVRRQLTL
jgi:hypothetical protein